MINIGVIGHTGRLGMPLCEILKRHPYARIVYTESRREGVYGNVEDAELIFLALPEGESEIYLSKLEDKRIIDLSNDHRCNNNWIYGIPELNRKKISSAQYVSNPGCYATSIILGLAPIKEMVRDVCVSSTSGISGAGMHVQEKDNFFIYKEGRQHRHISEIEKVLGLEKILFVPQRIDVADRGIISTIFAECSGGENLIKLYKEFYKSENFVKLTEEIKTNDVIGTNLCNIKISSYENKIIVISSLDNIIKGGAGQAVQNFNLMYGIEETTGLKF